jgi:hypothetical protein
MRMIDLKCAKCDRIQMDHLERDEDKNRPVCCDQPMERVFLPTATGGVKDDSIPGGIWIKNGLCNADGTPRRYDSWSDVRKEEQKRGYINYVEHKGSKGSDKSRHTSRWL